LDKLTKCQISDLPKSFSDLKYFSSDFISNGKAQYLKNLIEFNKSKVSVKYTSYFLMKIMKSVSSPTNPLFNTEGVDGGDSGLDVRRLLKYDNSLITLPLIEQLLLDLN
jgi:hypothetical protein